MTIEGGSFLEGIWYDYCKDCNTWFPNTHICPNPPLKLWQKLYLSWRKAPDKSVKKAIMLQAWVNALGGKLVEDDPEASRSE